MMTIKRPKQTIPSKNPQVFYEILTFAPRSHRVSNMILDLWPVSLKKRSRSAGFWEQQKDEDSISNRPNDRRNPAELTPFLVGCHNGEASEAVLMAGKEWTYYTRNYDF